MLLWSSLSYWMLEFCSRIKILLMNSQPSDVIPLSKSSRSWQLWAIFRYWQIALTPSSSQATFQNRMLLQCWYLTVFRASMMALTPCHPSDSHMWNLMRGFPSSRYSDSYFSLICLQTVISTNWQFFLYYFMNCSTERSSSASAAAAFFLGPIINLNYKFTFLAF